MSDLALCASEEKSYSVTGVFVTQMHSSGFTTEILLCSYTKNTKLLVWMGFVLIFFFFV